MGSTGRNPVHEMRLRTPVRWGGINSSSNELFQPFFPHLPGAAPKFKAIKHCQGFWGRHPDLDVFCLEGHPLTHAPPWLVLGCWFMQGDAKMSLEPCGPFGINPIVLASFVLWHLWFHLLLPLFAGSSEFLWRVHYRPVLLPQASAQEAGARHSMNCWSLQSHCFPPRAPNSVLQLLRNATL